jgi:hypothetical protein
MMTVEIVLQKLKDLANPEKVIYKEKKFGVVAQHSLGVYGKDLSIIAREIVENSELANPAQDVTVIYEIYGKASPQIILSKVNLFNNLFADDRDITSTS